jgi:peptidoglycan/LPS O-acetylase OafA/YrhL
VATTKTNRWHGIDGLRAFAVLPVIAAHAHVSFMHGGGVGVDIFFGISGFLITYLLLGEASRKGRIDLRKFWLRRALRLMPALLLLVVAVNILAIADAARSGDGSIPQSTRATPSVLFYFSNWMIVGSDSAYLGWFGPLWSLSVEEQFYLIWPLIVVAALHMKAPKRVLVGIAIALCVVAIAVRFATFDGTNLYRTFGTDFRMDMILAGVLLAIAMRSGFDAIVRRVSAVLIAPAIAYVVFVWVAVPEFGDAAAADEQRLYYTFGLPLVALSTVTLIGFLVTHQGSWLDRTMSIRPLEFTGRISYGLYLWHYAVISAVNTVTDLSPLPLLIVTLVGSYAAASLSWFLMEDRLNKRFHDRLRPTASEVAAPA